MTLHTLSFYTHAGLGVLALATGLIAWVSEILVGAIEPSAKAFGLNGAVVNGLDVEEWLIDRAGEQQARPADGQALAISPVATVDQIQFATRIQIITNMHAPA